MLNRTAHQDFGLLSREKNNLTHKHPHVNKEVDSFDHIPCMYFNLYTLNMIQGKVDNYHLGLRWILFLRYIKKNMFYSDSWNSFDNIPNNHSSHIFGILIHRPHKLYQEVMSHSGTLIYNYSMCLNKARSHCHCRKNITRLMDQHTLCKRNDIIDIYYLTRNSLEGI